MNRLPKHPLTAASSPLSGGNLAGAVQPCPRAAPATLPGELITADARTISPRAFLDFVTGSSPEQREARREQDRQACIRAIRNGSTYGFPPAMVAECREIIDDQETGWALAERSALR